MVGAFLGAAAVYLVYHDGIGVGRHAQRVVHGPGSDLGKRSGATCQGSGCCCRLLLVREPAIAEFFGTAVLLWGVLASGDSRNTGLMHNLGPFLVGFTVLAIGLSLGGPSGYAINPARDFAPRVFGTLVGTTGLFADAYWLIPLIIPLIGGVAGVFCYDWFVTRGLPEKRHSAYHL